MPLFIYLDNLRSNLLHEMRKGSAGKSVILCLCWCYYAVSICFIALLFRVIARFIRVIVPFFLVIMLVACIIKSFYFTLPCLWYLLVRLLNILYDAFPRCVLVITPRIRDAKPLFRVITPLIRDITPLFHVITPLKNLLLFEIILIGFRIICTRD